MLPWHCQTSPDGRSGADNQRLLPLYTARIPTHDKIKIQQTLKWVVLLKYWAKKQSKTIRYKPSLTVLPRNSAGCAAVSHILWHFYLFPALILRMLPSPLHSTHAAALVSGVEWQCCRSVQVNICFTSLIYFKLKSNCFHLCQAHKLFPLYFKMLSNFEAAWWASQKLKQMLSWQQINRISLITIAAINIWLSNAS